MEQQQRLLDEISARREDLRAAEEAAERGRAAQEGALAAARAEAQAQLERREAELRAAHEHEIVRAAAAYETLAGKVRKGRDPRAGGEPSRCFPWMRLSQPSGHMSHTRVMVVLQQDGSPWACSNRTWPVHLLYRTAATVCVLLQISGLQMAAATADYRAGAKVDRLADEAAAARAAYDEASSRQQVG